MQRHRPKNQANLMLLSGVMLLLSLLILIFGLVWPNLTIQAEPTLPPLESPTPTNAPVTPPPADTATPITPVDTVTPTPDDGGGDEDDENEGETETVPAGIAYIVLAVPDSVGGDWSIVQWQDAIGNWHDVEGWRGLLPSSGRQIWAVETKDFNTGPFRWQVRQGGPDGSVLGSSDAFTLPAGANQMLNVTVTLE